MLLTKYPRSLPRRESLNVRRERRMNARTTGERVDSWVFQGMRMETVVECGKKVRFVVCER